eukprot:CAMPEP_0175167856 /NCGR_PEP_ID=MMETSP0087-20121206/28601_1 /TAXON_ID=136419 /ORGANISM="Unknown Unknown, Strain D1" /LENGTH=84 /DNA_ID=CAMNT_0016457845 /DNA_START=141 /DNA_END=392 /DNA_ORIENTATION=-
MPVQPTAVASGTPGVTNGCNENFFCQICNTYFSSANQQVEHNRGRKHRNKAAQMGIEVEEIPPEVQAGMKRKADALSSGLGGGG